MNKYFDNVLVILLRLAIYKSVLNSAGRIFEYNFFFYKVLLGFNLASCLDSMASSRHSINVTHTISSLNTWYVGPGQIFDFSEL